MNPLHATILEARAIEGEPQTLNDAGPVTQAEHAVYELGAALEFARTVLGRLPARPWLDTDARLARIRAEIDALAFELERDYDHAEQVNHDKALAGEDVFFHRPELCAACKWEREHPQAPVASRRQLPPGVEILGDDD